jgi:hypothetical protein
MLCVFSRVDMVPMRQMCMVGGLFVVTVGVSRGGMVVVARSVLVVFRCLLVVFGCFMRHEKYLQTSRESGLFSLPGIIVIRRHSLSEHSTNCP